MSLILDWNTYWKVYMKSNRCINFIFPKKRTSYHTISHIPAFAWYILGVYNRNSMVELFITKSSKYKYCMCKVSLIIRDLFWVLIALGITDLNKFLPCSVCFWVNLKNIVQRLKRYQTIYQWENTMIQFLELQVIQDERKKGIQTWI